MTIRAKLALVLMLSIGAVTALMGAWFIRAQRRATLSAELERRRFVMESALRMARESLLAKDPLMLLDYLAYAERSQEGVKRCRVFMNGGWVEVGPPQAGEGEGEGESTAGFIVIEEKVPPHRLQVWFDRETIRRRTEEALQNSRRTALQFGGSLLLGGVLVAALLASSLTRRLTRIGRAMEVIGEGRWGSEVTVRGNDEVAKLALVFNRMSKKLVELDVMKKTFVASVTHELRSPLGAIQSHVRQLLADGRPVPEEVGQALRRIKDNAARLDHFVTNLLEMSKIERGKLEFHPLTSDLKRLAEDTTLFYKPRAAELGLDLVLELPERLPPVFMDPDLVAQVLGNLISNALKFTRSPGRVAVGARREDGAVVCAVSDTGIGLSPEDQARIFQPFERVPNPIKATGTGLGLAISKSIVELHKGRIGAKSEKGKGSVFYFTLPLT